MTMASEPTRRLADGLVRIRSAHPVSETIDRLAMVVAEVGMTVFARIDHAHGATEVGLALRPTELLVFGNAAGGTPLMQARQTVGIDLPLKALAWKDADGTVWLAYDDPSWIARRHGIGPEVQRPVAHMADILADLTARAASGEA
jgi:uncharacterized protein (DUF302 family)